MVLYSLIAVKPGLFAQVWVTLERGWIVINGLIHKPSYKAVSAMGVWTPREGSFYPLHSNKRI